MYAIPVGQRFNYQSSLGSDELRLLRPLNTTQERLSFTVVTLPRSFASSYTAVSYTWGDEQPSEVIYLDGKSFPVRRNLWSLLYHLGRFAASAEWQYLWVDAICINQNDNHERKSQVSLMDRTYRDAACVSVWLGLATIPEDYVSAWPTHIPIKTVDVDELDWADSMRDLANRPYWTRFWVIQEFLLGKEVDLYCSNSRINWQDFKGILCRVTDVDEFAETLETELDKTKSGSYIALPLVMGRHMDKHPEFLQPLWDLIIEHRSSKCKEPRDRIFALLGLVTTEEQQLLRRLLPNYEISEDHILIFTLAHLMQYGSLVSSRRQNASITVDSVEVFQGLGVPMDRSKRQRLLRRAEQLDYLHDGPGEEIIRMLAGHDELEPYTRTDVEQGFPSYYGSINGLTHRSAAEEHGRGSCSGINLLVTVVVVVIIVLGKQTGW